MTTQQRVAPTGPLLRPSAQQPVVVKLGGSALDAADAVLDEVAALWRAGWQPVLVHGGGPLIDAWLRRLGLMPQFHDGRRVTDAATLEVARAVMVGVINADLVRRLVARGVPAIGLSGLDAGLVRAQQRDPVLGLVGLDPRVDPTPVQMLLSTGYLPVIAPLALGPNDICLNINADDVALALARALVAARLAFISDVAGVRDGAGQVIAQLAPRQATQLLRDGAITGGMVPKVMACLAALDTVAAIYILDGAGATRLGALFAGEAALGTRIG
ncbi:MAG: acetylglutamate kinase [Ktedonobacterales bacterium]|nr:acetylglutamate kinase [Ktedonobacterales bacterium]